MQHGFEVIDDAAACAHTVAGDDDGRACGLGEVVEHGDMVGVVVDLDQVVECQGLAAGIEALPGLVAAEGFTVESSPW